MHHQRCTRAGTEAVDPAIPVTIEHLGSPFHTVREAGVEASNLGLHIVADPNCQQCRPTRRHRRLRRRRRDELTRSHEEDVWNVSDGN